MRHHRNELSGSPPWSTRPHAPLGPEAAESARAVLAAAGPWKLWALRAGPRRVLFADDGNDSGAPVRSLLELKPPSEPARYSDPFSASRRSASHVSCTTASK